MAISSEPSSTPTGKAHKVAQSRIANNLKTRNAAERTLGCPELLKMILISKHNGARILSTNDILSCLQVSRNIRSGLKEFKATKQDAFLVATPTKANTIHTLPGEQSTDYILEVHPAFHQRVGVDVATHAPLPGAPKSTKTFTYTIYHHADKGIPAFNYIITNTDDVLTANFVCKLGDGCDKLAKWAEQLDHPAACYYITKPALTTTITVQMVVPGRSESALIGEAKVRPCTIRKMFEVAAHMAIKTFPTYASNALIPTVGEYLKSPFYVDAISEDAKNNGLLIKLPHFRYDFSGWPNPDGLPELVNENTNATDEEAKPKAKSSSDEFRAPNGTVLFF